MGKTAKIWLDVSLRNMVIMLAAAAGMGVEAGMLLSLIPRSAIKEIEKATYSKWGELLARHLKDQERFKSLKNLVGHLTTLEKALCTAMVSLEDYNAIQDRLAATLGHPWRLREAGQYAITKSFGSEAVERLLLKAFVRWFTDPFVGLSQVAFGNDTFNHNKVAESMRAGLGRAYIFYRYRTGPEGIPSRNVLEDRRSVLYWIRGIFEAMVPVWPSCTDGWVAKLLRVFYPLQKRTGDVCYRVVAMSVRDLVRLEYPVVQQKVEDGRYFLRVEDSDWHEYGSVVELVPQRGGEFDGRYLGAYKTPEDSSRGMEGIQLSRDILAPGASGEFLPVALKGEIYAPNAPETVIEMRWVTHPLWSPLFRWFSAGPIAMQGFKLGVESEMRTAVAAAQAQTTTRQMNTLHDAFLEGYPTREIGEAVLEGTFPQEGIANTCAVIVADVVGFTRLQMAAEAAGKKEAFVHSVTDALDSSRADALLAGGWVKPTSGDQIIAFFPLSWGDFGKSAAEENGWGLPRVSQLAMETARSWRRNFEERGLRVRIALHVGELIWGLVAGNFDASGSAISVAAHVESVALKVLLLRDDTRKGIMAATADLVSQIRQSGLEAGRLGPMQEVELKRGTKVKIHIVP